MSVEIAEIVFFGIAALMGLVWLIGIRFAFSRLRARTYGREEDERPGEGDAGILEGEEVIEGAAGSLEKRIAERLAAAASPLGSPLVRITECTPRRIAFERVRGPSGSGRGVGFTPFSSGVITMTREGSRTRVRYEVSLPKLRLVTYLVCFAYGGLFVIGVPVLIWLVVVHHEHQAVRWQVLQTFQMVHGVWPPFLIGCRSGRIRKATADFFDAMFANLRFTA